jgi:hypothetical protein
MMGNLKTRLTRIESQVMKSDAPGRGISGLLAWAEARGSDLEGPRSGPKPTRGIGSLLTDDEWQELTEKGEHVHG